VPITKKVYVELPKVIKLSKLNDYNSISRTIEELLMKKYIIRAWPDMLLTQCIFKKL
jgi:hypothetical protein